MDENPIILLALGGLAFVAWSSFARTPPAVEAPAAGTAPADNVVTVTTGGAAPLGIKNNNPGNIKFSKANNWQGQIGRDHAGFVVFDTAPHGLRAMAKLLKVYYNKYHLTTLLAITRRWSPDAVGLSGIYAATVSKYTGIPAGAVFALTPDNLAKIMRGMIGVENGAGNIDHYPMPVILAAIAAA